LHLLCICYTARMDRPQLIRRLRIAVSVSFAVVAVALCVLWVRSYWRCDRVIWTDDAGTFAVSTLQGELTIEMLNVRVLLPEGWSRGSFKVYDGDDNSFSDNERRTLLGFGWKTGSGSIVADFPIWFLALTCAALPWISLRFSLRTLLIATTLVAVVLGMGVWARLLHCPVGGMNDVDGQIPP
jgi:hypothetical protein